MLQQSLSSLADSGDRCNSGGRLLAPVNPLIRYCRYAVLGLLVVGVPLLIASSSKLFLNPYPDRSWVVVDHFATILCSVGLLIWLCLIIGRTGSDAMKLWKKTKLGFIGAVGGIALLSLVLEHYYASSGRVGKADTIALFWLELFAGSYLLLRTSVFLTGASKN